MSCGSIELCVLASGSAGNCTLLRTPGGVVLIDAGIGPRTVSQRLEGTGVRAADVAAVVLTHLDRDHIDFNWFNTFARRRIPVFCHDTRAGELRRWASERGFEITVEPFTDAPFEPVPGTTFHPVHLPHDWAGTHAFVIEGHGCRVGFATDLGSVPDELLERFCDLDLLAIESNYDRRMQLDSPRPWFLKRRITGGRGHLSNDQALEAVRKILTRCERAGRRLPEHIVLLHRSQECNCPRLLRSLFSRDARIAPRLVLAEQYERTDWLRARREQPFTGEQLALAWG